MRTGSSILSDDRVDDRRSWPRQTNINGGETATAQVIRRPGHGPNSQTLTQAIVSWVKGRLRNYVGITTGVPQIADDLLQRPSRQGRAKTGLKH